MAKAAKARALYCILKEMVLTVLRVATTIYMVRIAKLSEWSKKKWSARSKNRRSSRGNDSGEQKMKDGERREERDPGGF
jgi:hypothetical protein